MPHPVFGDVERWSNERCPALRGASLVAHSGWSLLDCGEGEGLVPVLLTIAGIGAVVKGEDVDEDERQDENDEFHDRCTFRDLSGLWGPDYVATGTLRCTRAPFVLRGKRPLLPRSDASILTRNKVMTGPRFQPPLGGLVMGATVLLPYGNATAPDR